MGASLGISISQGTQDKANNRTYVSVSVYVTATGSTWNGYDSQCTGSLWGTFSGSWAKGFAKSSTTYLYSTGGWVSHDSNGYCTVWFGASYNTKVSPGTISASNSKSLTQLPTIKVTFNANGGSGAPSAQDKYYGTNLTLSSTKPTRYGYTFMGWGTSTTDTSVDYAAGGTYTSNSSNTLYAIWEKTITLNYGDNGGTGSPSSQTATIYNATTSYEFTISSTKPTRTGYDFLGWSLDINATTASYQPSGTITLSDTDILYAVWKLKTFQISYNANGGINPPSAQTKTYGVNIKLTTLEPTRSGYKFLGWSTNSSDEVPMYLSGATFTSNEDTILYAIWEQLGIAYININGTYQAGKIWVNDYGTWMSGIIFVNDNGTWKQGGI